MAMTIAIPDELEALGTSFQKMVEKLSGRMRLARTKRTPRFAEVENQIAESAAEIEREGNRAMLKSLDIDSERVLVEGKKYRRVLREESTYHTMAGNVFVMRSLYRECGTRDGRTVDAVSLRAGVVGDGWLPLTAQAMAHQLQQGTSREAEQTGRRLKRLEYSRSSFERVAHLVGDLVVTQHAEIEDEIMRELIIPDEARSVSVSLDRVSVPMEEPRPRPVGRPRKDAPKKPVFRNFRMAWAGTVTFHDEHGKALFTNRYGRMADADPTELAEGLVGDVVLALEQRPDLKVMALADGAHELWNLLGDALGGFLPENVEHTEIVDLWHLLEKLGSAGKVIFGEQKISDVMSRWRTMLLNNQSAAALILRELKNSGCENVLVGKNRPVHEAITYMTNHKGRMDYASARRAGLPVGSGNVEATCKSLFEIRMKRPGSRWKTRTGERVIQLRALALSDRWEQSMLKVFDPLQKSIRPLRKAS